MPTTTSVDNLGSAGVMCLQIFLKVKFQQVRSLFERRKKTIKFSLSSGVLSVLHLACHLHLLGRLLVRTDCSTRCSSLSRQRPADTLQAGFIAACGIVHDAKRRGLHEEEAKVQLLYVYVEKLVI